MRLLIICAVSLLAWCQSSSLLASEIRLAVTDLVGLEELQREFGAFVDTLEQATGHEVHFFPVSNRTAAAQALRFEKVDFVLTGPAEYVVLRKLTQAEPVVGFSRPDYYGILVALSDSNMTLPSELAGKKVALGSVGSTSKHLAPLQIMADYGLQPLTDLEIIHTRYPVAWEAMKRGDVHAVGITHDKFEVLRSEEADKGGLPHGAFRVIGRGPDLPNDVLLVGKHVEASLVQTVKRAFVEHSDELIAAILEGSDNQKYQGMKFIGNIQDSDYDYVRSMYVTAGYPEFAEFIGD
ncbi:MAG: PhnD/SsuA/transferrin family substrate-binding protein [Planctomycetota bacterium]